MTAVVLPAAAAEVGASAPAPSPCINICKMVGQPALCEGCLRSLEEIAAWAQMSNEQRQAVWLRLDQRRTAQRSDVVVR
jgi:uncharacterized protein